MIKQNEFLKLGFIGCGRATATLHLPALQQLPEAKVVALADVDPDQLKKVGDQFQLEQRYADYRSLLDDPSLDAIAICVPPQFHVEIALAVLEAGKHLFVEKPLALRLEECDRLIQKAKTANKKSLVGFNLRRHRLIQAAQKIIQAGGLGEIKAIRSTWTSAIRYHRTMPDWRNRRELGGGALFEIAVHHFDLWRWLLQSEVEEIFAFSQSTEWPDETVTITARMRNNVIVSALFSERTSDNNEMEIYGQNGRLRISLFRFDGLEFYSPSTIEGGIASRLNKFTKTIKALPTGIASLRQGGDYKISYRQEWQHFITAIRHDLPVHCSLEDGRAAVQIVLAAIKSASLGKPVKV
jgi:predicted dehydrogenase